MTLAEDRHDAYRRFVEAAVGTPDRDGYLFDAPRCRFKPEPRDELVMAPGAELVRAAQGIAVQLPGGASLPLVGFEPGQLRAAFAQLPCSYSRLTSQLGNQTEALIEQAFSRVLFAPKAVAELATELPAVELVRFPGSPYEIVRSYWRNSCHVRRRLLEYGVPSDAAGFCALLLELHELLLLGGGNAEGRSSFYLPASLLGRKRPSPGSFYEVPSGMERRGAETILTSGARVSVPLLGGANYWQLLAESVDDAGALLDERRLEVDSLDLGQVVRARADDETESRPWFLPPRPLLTAHFEALLADLHAAHAAEAAADLPAALAALGAFHYRFVRLHALPSGNQSLSMSFVNAALRRLLGSGIPHLLLDQLALRFELPAYQRLFARAARVWSAWSAGGAGAERVTASERLRNLMRMRAELNDFVSALGSSMTLLEARGRLAPAAAGNSSGMELALLSEA